MVFSAKRLQAYSLLLINTVVWGASLVVVKPALEEISPFQFLFLRFLLAGLLSIPILVYYCKKINFSLSTLLPIIGLEIVGTTVTLGILYLGLERTSAIEAGMISTTSPLFIVLMGVFFLKEREAKREWLGIFLSFLGIVLITLLPTLSGGAVSKEVSLLGNILIITANLTDAAYCILAKKKYSRLPKLFVAAISFIVGTMSFGFVSLWQVHWSITALNLELMNSLHSPAVVLAVVYMAVFGSIIGLAAYLKAQDLVNVSEASIFRYLQPVVYLPLGVIFLSETISTGQILGLMLILVGVWIAEKYRLSSKSKI